jgi:hypothetical protein
MIYSLMRLYLLSQSSTTVIICRDKLEIREWHRKYEQGSEYGYYLHVGIKVDRV